MCSPTAGMKKLKRTRRWATDMATFIQIDQRAAMILAGAGAIIASFVIAPDAAMGVVEQLIQAVQGAMP